MSQEDWNKKQQQLLAEIDAFASGKLRLPEDPPPAAAPAMLSTGFPLRQDAPTPAPAATAAPVQAAPAPAPEPAPAAAGGLLARLKQQAAEKQASEAQQSGLQERQKQAISAALQDTYSYLREFTEQINVLKPAYPGGYFLTEPINFEGLSWQEGRADYRRQETVTEERLFERVTLRYVLSAPSPLLVEKENPALETLRRTLGDYGLSFEMQEIKNERARTEKGRFTIKREVRAGLQFVADYDAGDIRLRTLNVQRFGSADYRIPVEVLTHATVEEIALLVLGESNQFVRRFKRVA